MSDRPAEVEKLGIEHVPQKDRHGSPGRVFTLWFAANLTIADYVIGAIATHRFGFTLSQSIPVLLLGNLAGGLFLGVASAMGPSLGFPQMLSSRASFGRLGNYLPGGMNWLSTAGWFSVNTILGAEAVQVLFPAASFAVVASILVLAQVLVAIYGHDFIHLFEKGMSVILGVLFLGVFVVVYPRLGEAAAFSPQPGHSLIDAVGLFGAAGILFVVAFSYLMSWAPYASDYSRYLPETASKRRVFLFALLGGALSSFAIEMLGAVVGILQPPMTLANGSTDYFGALYTVAGGFGTMAIVAIVLGALAANALNLYTNALSALVLDVRTKRWITVVAGSVVGFVVTLAVGPGSFEAFFESFLLALAYWITPWLAIVLVDFYLVRKATTESVDNPKRFDLSGLGVYLLSILISVPFMEAVPPLSFPWPLGALGNWFGYADVSYFVSFAVAGLLIYYVRKRQLRVAPEARPESERRG